MLPFCLWLALSQSAVHLRPMQADYTVRLATRLDEFRVELESTLAR
jgi:hypothetical protein